MLKTYRIIPLVFILFLFGFTFSTVSPLFAQTVDQLIESIEKLDANDRARVLEYKYSPPNRPSDATPAAAADGPWDKSMGMRHPARPCMKKGRQKGPRFGCGRDMRSPEQIASDPYDTNNPVSLAARAESGAHSPPPPPSDATPAAVADGPWDKSMGMRHPDRPCMKVNSCAPDTRSPEEIASDPFDTNNPVSLAARERVAAGLSPEDTNEVPHGKVRCICAGFGCIARCGHCEGIGAGTTPCQICALADGKLKC